MHDGNLARRSTEAYKSQLEPEPKRLDKGRLLHWDQIATTRLQLVCALRRQLASFGPFQRKEWIALALVRLKVSSVTIGEFLLRDQMVVDGLLARNFYRTFFVLSPSCCHELRSQAALQ